MAQDKDKLENIRIDITDGFAVEKALKKFKRLCDAYGIVKEYRSRESYKKPSVKDKEKREDAEKRSKKTNSKTYRFRTFLFLGYFRRTESGSNLVPFRIFSFFCLNISKLAFTADCASFSGLKVIDIFGPI